MRNFITDCCHRCGDDITEYEQTEQVGNELLITYKCNVCGFYGEQHYTLNYTGTVELGVEERRRKLTEFTSLLEEAEHERNRQFLEKTSADCRRIEKF